PQQFHFLNRQTSREAEALYETTVQPALESFAALSAGDPDRLLRVRSRCASLLGLLAMGFDWAACLEDSERILTQALELARGSLVEKLIQNDLQRVKAIRAHNRRLSNRATVS